MLAVKTNKPVNFSESAQVKAREIMDRYPTGKHKSAIIPILHIAQEENENWLSVDTMDDVAGLMKIKPVEVYEVATFYSMFNLKPVGRFLLEVCHTGPCAVRGAEWLIDYLCSKLNIKPGGTTADNMFTVKGVECLGACGYAPMMQIGKYYYEHLDTPEKVDALIEQLRNRVDYKHENWVV
jgi:NADH-quinone oxidoreductase subunit E